MRRDACGAIILRNSYARRQVRLGDRPHSSVGQARLDELSNLQPLPGEQSREGDDYPQ